MSSKDNVTKKQKDPKRQEAAKKGHEKYMAKLKEDILKNSSMHGGVDGTNGGTDGTTGTVDGGNGSSTYTNFSYIHGVGAVAVLALGVCIFVIPKLTKTKTEPSEKKEKQPKIKRNML